MAHLTLQADLGQTTISRHIYGHFSEHLGRCIYGGYWVGEESPIPNTKGIRNDVVAALKAAKVPNMRWPGGCFADEYHWMDGIGPRGQRPSMINTHWGGVTENNHFGTHEFMELCAQLACEPYICGNVGSGTVQEMSQWVEYLTMAGKSPMADLRRANGREEPWSVRFWGVGNENWGCGGNMRAEYYADVYRRYACYCRNYGGNKLFKVACGYDYHWNEVLMREAARFMDGLSIHHYTLATSDWKNKGAATGFPVAQWYTALQSCLRMDELLTRNEAIMDQHDPQRRVALVVDEWGIWTNVEPGTNPGFLYQQNSLRDALIAGITLNIFNQHASRVRIANIAQTVNVLQAMVLTEGEKMLLTPTYHVFRMYAAHQDATLLPLELDTPVLEREGCKLPAVSASASRDAAGKVHLTLCHLDPEQPLTVTCSLRGSTAKTVTGEVLTAGAMDAHNTFAEPNRVQPAPFTGAVLKGETLTVTLPAMSVVALELA